MKIYYVSSCFKILGIMNSFEEIDHINLQIWQNQYNDPNLSYKKSKDILGLSQQNAYEKGIAYASLNMAKACFLKSENQEAFDLVSQCLSYFYENTDEIGYAWLLVLQGNMMESIGDYEKGLELCMKSLKRSHSFKDFETEAEASSVLGLIYTRLCNFNKALDYYKRALKIREEMGDEGAVASSLNRIGMINRLVGDYEQALKYYFQSLEIRERKKLAGAIPCTMLGLASTFEDMGNFTEALEYYQKGASDCDKRCVLQCKIGIGRIHSKQGNDEIAEISLQDASTMALELNAKPLLVEIFGAFAAHYEKKGQYEMALKYFRKYQETKESVLNEEAQNKLRNIEISHAVEKTTQEKEIYRLKHVELKAAFDLIEQRNKEITDSINYARFIQQAILPNISEIDGFSDHCLIYYQPKAVIGGDFYWFTEHKSLLIIAAADCTGHGVPGALMSMLGLSLLNEIVNEKKVVDAGEILDMLRYKVISSLRQLDKNNRTKDGMDISLCVLDRSRNKIQFAGANNSLCIVRKGELMEYKADSMPIGVHDRMNVKFRTIDIDVVKGDMLYLRSDGYADQFGGLNQRKFMLKNLKELFVELHKLPIDKQREMFEQRFLDWKGDNEQIDDVLILGYKI